MLKNKICEICGKPYLYQLRIKYLQDGIKICFHDNEFKTGLHFDIAEQSIIKKLPNHQFLAKGNDGLCRICEKTKK